MTLLFLIYSVCLNHAAQNMAKQGDDTTYQVNLQRVKQHKNVMKRRSIYSFPHKECTISPLKGETDVYVDISETI